MKSRLTKAISIALTVCCLCVFCFPAGSFAASKLPAPKNVKIVTDRNGVAGSGIRVFAKYKKVKKADGYQIKTTQVHYSHPGTTTRTFKKNTKKTKKLVTENYDFVKVTIKVRAYKIRNGEKVYGKWSKAKTKKF